MVSTPLRLTKVALGLMPAPGQSESMCFNLKLVFGPFSP